MLAFFVSDLHGSLERFEKLFSLISEKKPDMVFIGGDILPGGNSIAQFSIEKQHQDFINDYLKKKFMSLKQDLGSIMPAVFLILGNDDARFFEAAILDVAVYGVWHYIHNRRFEYAGYTIYGYSYSPPSPFRLKDWERFDVSRYTDPGAISPLEGQYTIPAPERDVEYQTIADDLKQLAGNDSLSNAIMLFHAPPYKTHLDRAALDGKTIDHVPLDVHVGSIAIQRFIRNRQPKITLHGHIHESARITGYWWEKIGNTFAFSAAHDGPELVVVCFDPALPEDATRMVI